MADERIRQAVKITDPTTDANEAGVDGSGNLQTVDTNLATAAALSDNFANPTTTQVGAMAMGWDGSTWDRIPGDATAGLKVDLGSDNDVSTELPAAAALSDGNANPTTPMIGANTLGWDRVNSDWTRIAGVVDGEAVGALNAGFLAVGTDGSNYQVLATDSSGNLQVDVLTGGGGITDTDDDSVAFAQVPTLSLSVMYGSNGSEWERITTDGAGSMDVNVTVALPTGTNEVGDIGSINTNIVPGVAANSLGKAESAAHSTGDTGVALLAVRDDTPVGLAADGQYIPLTTDSVGRLHVTDPNAGAGTPGTPVIDRPALANVAAGAASTGTELRTSDLGGNTHQLSGFDVSSSVPYKFELISEIDDVETIRVTGFGRAGEIVQWRPSNKAYYLQIFAANAGFDGWRVEVTNSDNSQAADFYTTFYYED